jgi:signal transduction histidine kinase
VAPGTGLGLAIAKGLIEALGGAIWVTSPRPHRAADALPGTVIHIKVPLA